MADFEKNPELEEELDENIITLTDEEDIRLETFYDVLRGLQEDAEEAWSKDRDMRMRPPEAPFSKNYHEFVLKTLLREAAENGYDRLAWTTADMQSERWSDEYGVDGGYALHRHRLTLPRPAGGRQYQFSGDLGYLAVGGFLSISNFTAEGISQADFIDLIPGIFAKLQSAQIRELFSKSSFTGQSGTDGRAAALTVSVLHFLVILVLSQCIDIRIGKILVSFPDCCILASFQIG